ncbi:2-phospho-L-lactate transferase [Nocardioides cavernaquae]|uniref:2-phospho-L-lactate transferase n=1 Tax=Nocardioides cavernaquae TaxID=2321396 RepID=A0A3A5HF17_9ACTN|nr:2-phospho-L-lactate transferase [Nocardioides cavernaquae]RJS46624.1 2-phospho-L-lactate transferase [Nocardioides cavernaquae]
MESQLNAITVLSGGTGGARFLQGLLHGIHSGLVSPTARVTIVANTADDVWMHGLKISPDLDAVMYTLGDGIDPEHGSGRRNETRSAQEELAAYGVEPTWFTLGDREIATHLVRTQMLEAGYPLSQITAALCKRWLSPAYGDTVRLVPMSDDRVETHVAIADPDAPSGRRVVHVQEYFVRLHAEVPAEAVAVIGLDESVPAPGVLAAIAEADLVILPPSNPIVSLGPILGVPGIVDALRATSAKVVGVSPVIGDRFVGSANAGASTGSMGEQLMTATGVEVSAAGVAKLYAARSAGGVLDGWLVDSTDAAVVAEVEALGMACRAVPLLMTDHAATATMATAAIELVG